MNWKQLHQHAAKALTCDQSTGTKVLFRSKVFYYILRRMPDSEIAVESRTPLNQLLWQYSYLQILDFLTTIAFLVNGVREGNPLVRLALSMGSSPLVSLLTVKLLAILLGFYCWRVGKRQLLSRINVLFALLIAWNLVALIVRSVHP
jgi:Domain of unknown function (DUF5658)